MVRILSVRIRIQFVRLKSDLYSSSGTKYLICIQFLSISIFFKVGYLRYRYLFKSYPTQFHNIHIRSESEDIIGKHYVSNHITHVGYLISTREGIENQGNTN
jgi:hypothetical protein